MGETERPMVWRIALRRAPGMATRPEPIYATTEAERDWWLARLTRPREEYHVDHVPDPIDPTIRAWWDDFNRRHPVGDTP
jgi:hypothetical protein